MAVVIMPDLSLHVAFQKSGVRTSNAATSGVYQNLWSILARISWAVSVAFISASWKAWLMSPLPLLVSARSFTVFRLVLNTSVVIVPTTPTTDKVTGW